MKEPKSIVTFPKEEVKEEERKEHKKKPIVPKDEEMVRIRQESEANVEDDSIVNDGDGASRSIGLDHRKPSEQGANPKSK